MLPTVHAPSSGHALTVLCERKKVLRCHRARLARPVLPPASCQFPCAGRKRHGCRPRLADEGGALPNLLVLGSVDRGKDIQPDVAHHPRPAGPRPALAAQSEHPPLARMRVRRLLSLGAPPRQRIFLIRHGESQGNKDETLYCRRALPRAAA